MEKQKAFLPGSREPGSRAMKSIWEKRCGKKEQKHSRSSMIRTVLIRISWTVHRKEMGTYVHGIFDKEEVAERIVEALAKNKGIAMEQIHGVDYQTFKETQYDILADALREHLDMKKIYQILEEGA